MRRGGFWFICTAYPYSGRSHHCAPRPKGRARRGAARHGPVSAITLGSPLNPPTILHSAPLTRGARSGDPAPGWRRRGGTGRSGPAPPLPATPPARVSLRNCFSSCLVLSHRLCFKPCARARVREMVPPKNSRDSASSPRGPARPLVPPVAWSLRPGSPFPAQTPGRLGSPPPLSPGQGN